MTDDLITLFDIKRKFRHCVALLLKAHGIHTDIIAITTGPKFSSKILP